MYNLKKGDKIFFISHETSDHKILKGMILNINSDGTNDVSSSGHHYNLNNKDVMTFPKSVAYARREAERWHKIYEELKREV